MVIWTISNQLAPSIIFCSGSWATSFTVLFMSYSLSFSYLFFSIPSNQAFWIACLFSSVMYHLLFHLLLLFFSLLFLFFLFFLPSYHVLFHFHHMTGSPREKKVSRNATNLVLENSKAQGNDKKFMQEEDRERKLDDTFVLEMNVERQLAQH
ncbi:hypothetical protein L228DRAFT_134627 [Xylona heveae TC161]|uniref:Uncharacterized protein n=1 Tax=Xylona heveae (strain CBS 132557 / TC161) TaxID=1328760 RepID=A0A165GXG8_XYLHT|nr:hypothetical protein L228DRAFT_134627 [Xylona heveae TC161]KZF22725.1 hypothetical protein L228DRAFT_134627 [Xylona heveae TC161]